VAREAGLKSKTIFGSEHKNRFLLETTGCGAAFFDYDNDGWLDIFLVNGTRFEAKYAKGAEPTNRLYKNNRDGTFTDITAKAGLLRTGWGQGVCAGDYDNDGHDDLFVADHNDSCPDNYVANDPTSTTLYKNKHDGTFSDVAIEGGVAYSPDGKPQAGMGVAAVDYNCDGNLDLVKTNFAGDTSSL